MILESLDFEKQHGLGNDYLLIDNREGVIAEKDGRINVNLVNTAGDCRNEIVYTYDDIPPVGPVTVKVRIEREPQQVLAEPAGEKLEFTYDGSTMTTVIPRVEIHEPADELFVTADRTRDHIGGAADELRNAVSDDIGA